jgi:hypothetical protein
MCRRATGSGLSRNARASEISSAPAVDGIDGLITGLIRCRGVLGDGIATPPLGLGVRAWSTERLVVVGALPVGRRLATCRSISRRWCATET